MWELLFGFATSFVIVLFATPVLIKVAKLKHLVDEPGDERKLHHRSIPTIGGIMIFAGTIIGYSLWFPSTSPEQLEMSHHANILGALGEFKFLIACMFILFFLGLKDDIIGVSPSKKLLVHMVVGMIIVLMADIRITNFWGLFNIDEIPTWASIMLSLFTYIVIVNAINLIDGVDGLAAGIGFISSCAFAYWFYRTGDLPLAVLGLALAGSLLGFLVFNFQPARIFMGDSGSLVIGFVVYVMAVKLIEIPVHRLPLAVQGVSKPVLAMALLCYPLLDTLRVFVLRAIQGRSPFSADKNHIHHKLLGLGLNHRQTVLVLYAFQALIVALCFFMPDHKPNISFLIVGGTAVLFAQGLFLFKSKSVD